MEQEYIYVVTELHKGKHDGKFVIDNHSKELTGINDPKRLILYIKLNTMHWGTDAQCNYKLWKGPKYADRLGFDTSEQIGDSYVECLHHAWGDTRYVYELYKRS